MHKLRHIFLLLATAATVNAGAQGLRKEISVQHDIVPEQTDVTMLRFTPRFVMPQLQRPTLEYSSRSVFSVVQPTISVLGPAAWADSIATSSYRGYAVLGFAPLYNLNASAGYKFIDNDRTRLNAWLQYNGTAYKGRYGNSPLDGQYQRQNTVTAAANLHHALNQDKYLDFGVDYTFGRYSTPATTDSTGRQQMHRFNFSGLFSGSNSTLSYSAGAGIGIFNYAFSPYYEVETELPDGSWINERLHPAHETKLNLQGGLSTKITEHQRAGVNLDFSMLSNSRHSHTGFMREEMEYRTYVSDRHTHALLTFAPYYRLRMNAVELHAGLKAQLTFNSGKAVHVAPDVNLTWRPASQLAIYAKAGGGEWQNTLSSLFDVSPYTLGSMAFKNSHIPVTIEGGLTFGPLKGASVELSWLYAAANDWLMPITLPDGPTIFTPTKMRGYKLHAGVTYQYGTTVELRTAYEMAPQGPSRGFYLWRDRAKHSFTASIKITPVTPLDIYAGWEYRGGRTQICPHTATEQNLGFISNLQLGGLYRISSQWSAFVRGENLLCRRYLMIGGVPAQGITGLIGATYKF